MSISLRKHYQVKLPQTIKESPILPYAVRLNVIVFQEFNCTEFAHLSIFCMLIIQHCVSKIVGEECNSLH